MAKDIDKMISALSAKKVPIATLDNKWHRLFAKVEKTHEIEKLEKKLNELLRRQGKINNEIKEIKKIKKNLMDEIVSLMENESEADKVEKNKKLIDDCNAKIDAYNDENMDLPKEIFLKTFLLKLENLLKLRLKLKSMLTNLKFVQLTMMRRLYVSSLSILVNSLLL